MVYLSSMYNVILGRSTLSRLKSLASICTLTMTILTPKVVHVVKADLIESRTCYKHSLNMNQHSICQIEDEMEELRVEVNL